MAGRRSSASLLMVLSIVLAGCAAIRPGVVKISQSDKGSTISISRKEVLQLSLPSNPTTGYSWLVVSQGDPILKEQLPFTFQQQGSGVGAGGVAVFTFTPTQVGGAWITMIYHRAFEPEVPPIQTFEVQVQVVE